MDKTQAGLRPPPSPIYVRHVKRGTLYEILGEAEGQLAQPVAAVREGTKLTIYRSLTDGRLWWRFPDEFADGRFVWVWPGEAQGQGQGQGQGEAPGMAVIASGLPNDILRPRAMDYDPLDYPAILSHWDERPAELSAKPKAVWLAPRWFLALAALAALAIGLLALR